MMSAQLQPVLMTESDMHAADIENLTREEKIRYLYSFHKLFKENSIEIKDKIQAKIEAVISTIKEDIEYSHALVLYAEILSETENKLLAKEIILLAKQVAQSRGMQFDFLNSIIIEGRLAAVEKEYEKCYTLYRQALQIAKSIAEQLTSEKDRSSFQQKKEIIFLVSEIKKLASIVGNKKEQVL